MSDVTNSSTADAATAPKPAPATEAATPATAATPSRLAAEQVKAGDDDNRPLTRADLAKALAEMVKPVADGAKAAKDETGRMIEQHKAERARADLLTTEPALKGLPKTYLDLIPVTADTAKLKAAVAEVVARVNADFDGFISKHPRSKELRAILFPNTTTTAGQGGDVPGAKPLDLTGKTPEQLIGIGMANARLRGVNI